MPKFPLYQSFKIGKWEAWRVLMGILRLYAQFMARNPVFSVYAIGVKIIMGHMIYTEIRDKMRDNGRALANGKST